MGTLVGAIRALTIPAALLLANNVSADDGYRTPLAGEPLATTVLGKRVEVGARDRSNVLALTVGTTLYAPSLGSTDILPITALYWRKETEAYRSRLVFSLFYNEWDGALKMANGLELLGHLENYTNPFPQEEILNGKAIEATSAVWGYGTAWLGLGYRLPVAPFQSDNDLRLQLFYTGTYLYNRRTPDTGPEVRLPPDTWENGMRLRVRYDGMRRNIMELPHRGFAAGADLEWAYRSPWSDSSYGSFHFSKGDTQQYLKISGYGAAALPVPGLSERDRLIASVYGGFSPKAQLDRYSGFKIGGGPFPNESDDLWRTPYPGALFNQFTVADYVVGTLEYRRELQFFLYLHLRGTVAWINRDFQHAANFFAFEQERGEALSVGLTSGLPWDSTLYLEFSRDFGILRNGSSGSGLLLLWSKMF
ncbi:hypothetical protein [Trichlorobacter ammonificans]|uniref:Outer membrane channel n=1 Tax=Trichlorobacter ammonificans TaxID=2916410 RepID=A0ABN8HM52_9BACT|nr:hypothetical protein [Trichlorobacter ammonificans]CAH2032669.1 putative Outer membrane channel [Trichlorobacter ammonificans]